MSSSLVSRIERFPQPHNGRDAILPILEAISNSLMSVEERFGNAVNLNGNINISMKGTGEGFQCTVTDNGFGMNDKNFEAFCVVDTPNKITKGGKGVGRLFWLAAFHRVHIESIYKDSFLSRRSFDFCLLEKNQTSNYDDQKISRASLLNNDSNSIKTAISFYGLKDNYAEKFPHTKGTKNKAPCLKKNFITSLIIGNFLPSLISATFPRLIVEIEGKTENYSELVERNITNKAYKEKSQKGGTRFSLTLLECNASLTKDDGEKFTNLVHFVGNDRVVISHNIDTIYGIREAYDGNDGLKKCFRGIVRSKIFDRNVNQERTGFTGAAATVDIKDICKLFDEEIREFLSEPLKVIRDTQKKALKTVLALYPSVKFGNEETMLEQISSGGETEPDKIYSRFSLERYRRDEKRNRELNEIAQHLEKKEDIDDVFAQKLENMQNSIKEEELKSLAEYVVRRKTVLEMFEKGISYIKDKPTGKDSDYTQEKILHSLLYPMKTATVGEKSDKTPSGHDLWIVDERLTFTQFITSDKPLKETVKDNDSLKRPDLIVFDKIMGFRENGKDSARIMIVEFKRPGREHYKDSENPVEQIKDYRRSLTGKSVKTSTGRVIHIPENCIFHCYIIADRLGKLATWTGEWFPTPDTGRWLAPQGTYPCFIELIEWSTLLENAKMRNAPLFEQLGIH